MIGLIDGPIDTLQPGLASAQIQAIGSGAHCRRLTNSACSHGTFIAAELSAARNSGALGICPDCTILARPIFLEEAVSETGLSSATYTELAKAVYECINAGARLINLSLGLTGSFANTQNVLTEALNYAAKRGVLIVAAAGNQGNVGGSLLIRHPAVVPVAACDVRGRPLAMSNLGRSIALRGLSAPGDQVSSLAPAGGLLTLSGTSVAAPFVTGTLALLLSRFSNATAPALLHALSSGRHGRTKSIVPPLLDAWGAYLTLGGAQ